MTVSEFVEAKARERDQFELELSDAFDVKASIVLLILTFLGTISATLLTTETLSAAQKLTQKPVIVFVVISGIFCVACLWPRTYLLDDLPETYSTWAGTLQQPDAQQVATIINLSLTLASGRINQNHALNKTKAWYLNRAFWSMTVGLFLELASIAYIAIH